MTTATATATPKAKGDAAVKAVAASNNEGSSSAKGYVAGIASELGVGSRR